MKNDMCYDDVMNELNNFKALIDDISPENIGDVSDRACESINTIKRALMDVRNRVIGVREDLNAISKVTITGSFKKKAIAGAIDKQVDKLRDIFN